jgi:hypothetical protein
MILEEIQSKLREIDPNVYYGMVDSSQNETEWNYIVFNRTEITRSANKTGASDRFDVHIIRENFIPEGVDTEVVDALCSIPGVRVAGENSTFTYVQKPNTNIVVEMLTIPFVRARKA